MLREIDDEVFLKLVAFAGNGRGERHHDLGAGFGVYRKAITPVDRNEVKRDARFACFHAVIVPRGERQPHLAQRFHFGRPEYFDMRGGIGQHHDIPTAASRDPLFGRRRSG